LVLHHHPSGSPSGMQDRSQSANDGGSLEPPDGPTGDVR